MKIPKISAKWRGLLRGGIYFVPEQGKPKRVAIRGFVPGLPIEIEKGKTYVYVSSESARRALL